MTLLYSQIGIAATLASFALVHLAASLASSLCLAGLRDAAGERSPASRAQLAFFLGIFPTLAAALAAALTGLAYLRHEPRHQSEDSGLPLILVALTGALLVAGSLASGVRAWWRTRSFVRSWLAASTRTRIAGADAAVAEHAHPLVSVVGVLQPRLLLEKRVLGVLTREELALVISHERAHLRAGDNLRQQLLAACRDWPGVPCARRARTHLSRASELAADAAAARTPDKACTLAGALVKLARLVPTDPATVPLASTFVRRAAIAHRVAVLMSRDRGPELRGSGRRTILALTLLAAATAGLSMLPELHAATETLVRLGR